MFCCEKFFFRPRIKIMESSGAKRPRLCPRNPEEIIQEQRRIIENLKARNQQLEKHNRSWLLVNRYYREKQVEKQLKNSESSATETKIKKVPELPDEIWLKIMSYLSTYDMLRNVAQISKRFHKLSEDPHVIRKIEVESVQSWPKNKEEKY